MTRARLLEAADIELLVAKRQAAQSAGCPALVGKATESLLRVVSLYKNAGLTRRSLTVARYAYRLLKARRRRFPQYHETLTDALLDHRFGSKPEGGAK